MSWLKIGTVGRPHGLQGFFYVGHRDDPIPSAYNEVLIGASPETGRKAEVRESRFQGGRALIMCSLAADRNAAEALRGQAIWLASEKVELDDDHEYLWSDLEGRTVVDNTGTDLGRVHAVYNSGANDILVVHDQAGRSLELPIVEAYVDMSFKRGESTLALVVAGEVFTDLWIDAPAKPEGKKR